MVANSNSGPRRARSFATAGTFPPTERKPPQAPRMAQISWRVGRRHVSLPQAGSKSAAKLPSPPKSQPISRPASTEPISTVPKLKRSIHRIQSVDRGQNYTLCLHLATFGPRTQWHNRQRSGSAPLALPTVQGYSGTIPSAPNRPISGRRPNLPISIPYPILTQPERKPKP